MAPPYEADDEQAAIALQAAVRGRHSRQALAGKHAAARALQAVYRGLRTRCELAQPTERSTTKPKRKQSKTSSGSESKRKEHGVEETRLSALRWLEAESDKCNEAEYTHVWEAPEIQSWWKEAGEEEDAMQITRTTKSSTSRKSRSSSRMLGGFVSARSPRKSKS